MSVKIYQYVLLFWIKYLDTLSPYLFYLQLLMSKGVIKANAVK